MSEIASFVALSDIQERLNDAFIEVKRELASRLASVEIHHVGASSIPGSLTKGDLDVAVATEPALFNETLLRMDRYAERHLESLSAEIYQPYTHSTQGIAVGIQVFVAGSEFERRFLGWRDQLRQDEGLLAQYNALKTTFEGKLMADYRTAKSAFIQRWLEQENPF